ncbi:MAG: DUF962 domain-containing protein [Halioglobus sp.]|nr:DUF962 domain-containing protein [Halioglobus sp.]
MHDSIKSAADKEERSAGFASFAAFYDFYLSEHSNPTCRRLHFIGTALILILTAYILITGSWLLAGFLPLIGYGFAWLGHVKYEKNKPATFKYPLYSLMGDFIMLEI